MVGRRRDAVPVGVAPRVEIEVHDLHDAGDGQRVVHGAGRGHLARGSQLRMRRMRRMPASEMVRPALSRAKRRRTHSFGEELNLHLAGTGVRHGAGGTEEGGEGDHRAHHRIVRGVRLR